VLASTRSDYKYFHLEETFICVRISFNAPVR
jgi:hypothetical protein